MLRLLADENFNGRILRALLRRIPDLDVLRVQDTPLYQAEDQELLEWAAGEGRVLLTHDVATLVGFANGRLRSGLPMPGVIAIRTDTALGAAIEDLYLVAAASEPGEWEGRILFIPL